MRETVLHFSIIFVLGCIALLAGCDLWMRGSKGTGYEIEMQTKEVNMDQLARLETILIDEGFKMIERERSIPERNHPARVISNLALLMNLRLETRAVMFDVTYEKDTEVQKAVNLRFIVGNWKVGGIIPELKAKIDNTADLVYDFLINAVGKENVTREFYGDAAKKP